MCENIDSVVILFDRRSVILLNLCVSFIMFGVALDINLDDFKRVAKTPKLPIVGLISEYMILPLLTLLLIYIFEPQPSFALGMILLTTCPGGSASNFFVHLSGGNTGLSVTLTTITTLGAIVITPLGFELLARLFPYTSDFLQTISVNPLEMVVSIVIIVILPLAAGVGFRTRYPDRAKRIQKPISNISVTIFFVFVTIALIANWANLSEFLHCVFLTVTLHNILALTLGYWFARLMGLSIRDSRAVSIETGIQNTALGLALAVQFFNGLGGMMLVLAWWGIWHLISGYVLSMYWSRKPTE